MAISDLIEIVPPPTGQDPVETDWAEVETRIGLPLPQDYKDYITRYGAGDFDDFLHVCLPATTNEELDLASRRQMDIDALRELQNEFEEEIPYRVADPAELLPVAVTTNGDIVYWHVTDPNNPDSWTITVNESRGPEWFRYNGSLTSFLADTLSRRIRVSVFPSDFPDPEPAFTPYDV